MDDVDFYLMDLKSKFNKIDPDKYYLSYSGGKDSHLLFWFLRRYLRSEDWWMWDEYKRIPIVSVNTYMEFPKIVERMIKNADEIIYPDLFPHEVIEKYGSPCFGKNDDQIIERYQNGSRSKSTMQYINKTKNNGNTMFGLSNQARRLLYDGRLPKVSAKCCTYLKKKPFKKYEKRTGRKAILGVSGSESMMRKAQYQSCFAKNGKFTPLHDMTEKLLNEIYKKYDIELPTIYKYINQTGCAGCPYGINQNHTETELQLLTPQKRKYVISLFKDVYDVRGVNYNQTSIYDFLDGDLAIKKG
jgi:3'-phosphoadenosine 5'-phosphosulfate sulfotransferase (PAPS reductase)/FAD synthetase